MKKQSIILGAFLAVIISSCGSNNSSSVALKEGVTTYTATPYNSENLFVLNDEFSSEFDGDVNNDNFDKCDKPCATWSMKAENITVEDGVLNITTKYDKHISQTNKQFYFSSGILRSKTAIAYGYFEARIKGADLWPGVCPAFWLSGKINDIQDLPINTITRGEIDVIELQQVASSKNILALNLHTQAVKEGKDGKKENLSLKAGIIPKICKTEFAVDWNPEDDYHIYACENRPDSILFYIDNVRVGAKPNLYWHIPMTVKVSMGIRTPYERYEAWDRFAVPATEEEAKAAGFPTTMYVDYMRTYTRDYSEFKSLSQPFDMASSGYNQEKIDMVLKTRKENL